MKPAILLLTGLAAFAQNPLTVGGDFRGMFERSLTRAAEAEWTARSRAIASLRTPEDVARRQAYVRAKFVELMGGFPSKTPLNARITGTLDREDYRVEALIYESQPKFYVTASVYVPKDAKPPFAAVIGVAGHSDNGRMNQVYQQAWIGLVKRGFLVLAFDPPGQGERSEYFDPETGKSRVGIGTREHSMAGTQCLLTGTTYARWETWDGVRAFDYLLTRPDVDARRIAVAGNSGGGTQSAYLAVAEPRLASGVASCYLTSWEKLWAGPGPQDAEQNFPGFLKAGLDFPDFPIAFAPKPFLMTTAIQDFFPIDGARATYKEVSRVFELDDAPGRAGYFEYNDTHGWTKPRREAMYRWFEKWLHGREDSGAEPGFKTDADAELRATATGQVATSLGGETVQSLNLAIAEAMYRERTFLRRKDRSVIGLRLGAARKPGAPPVTKAGETRTDCCVIEKLAMETEPGLRIPALLYQSNLAGKRPAVIWIDSAGKTAAWEDIEAVEKAGTAVLAVDLRGWGEGGGTSGVSGYDGAWQNAWRAMLVGKTLAGMRTVDVLAAFDYLASRPEIDASRISIRGRGNGAVIALFAAALQPKIVSVTVEGGVLSYMAIARAKTHRGLTDIIVPEVLRDFDLPDVAVLIAPRPLCAVSPRDPEGAELSLGEARKMWPARAGLRFAASAASCEVVKK